MERRAGHRCSKPDCGITTRGAASDDDGTINIGSAAHIPAPELRRELFKMVVSDNAAESQLAAECLTAIDQIRDDYGHVDSEPRHPDITTGVPWPQI